MKKVRMIKQLEGKTIKIIKSKQIHTYIYIYEMGVIYRESRGRGGIKLSLTKQQ